MIDWKLIAISEHNQEVELDLLATTGERHQLKETDYIQFKVLVDEETFLEQGEPSVLIGDIPLELEFHHHSEGKRIFISSDPLNNKASRYFFNFFGESELNLLFERSGKYLASCTVDIMATKENAELASEMLSYITDNLEDAVAVCFSRSKVTGGYDRDNSFKFTRLDIAKQAIDYLLGYLPLFIREHKHTWKAEMQFSDRGQPTGPDSVHWVFSNLDKLSPACTDEANIIYNNRSYRIDTLPKEGIISETDIFENRVIHTFLYTVSMFLIELRDAFNVSMALPKAYSDGEYVRFDHTMQKYTHLALRHKVQYIEQLLFSAENLKKFLSKLLPAKIVPGIQPKMTAYVAKHSHYSHIFKLIEQCNTAPAPTFEGNSILLGLKNLSIIYEITSLLMIIESIKRCLLVETVEQSYRLQGENIPFGGVKTERPYGEVNNYFVYRSDIYDIELFYEPMILPYSPTSSVGDLVDVSDTRATSKYGAHHFCPDFILKICSSRWRKPLTIVLDAKFKSASVVKNYDINPLTLKYLLNIHQVNATGGFGISPIQALLLLFAREGDGLLVRTVAKRHAITGALPVLPQAAGVIFKPSKKDWFDEHLKALITIMNKEQQ